MQATKPPSPTQSASAPSFASVRPRQTVDYMLGTLQSTLASFSAMADAKANIMITICSVALTLGLTQRPDRMMEWPLMLLTISAFVALFLSVLAVLPSGRHPRNPDGTVEPRPPGLNPLYFGHFAHLSRERFAAELCQMLEHDERIYEAIANDLWNQGVVLARRKYRYLRWVYQALLAGCVQHGRGLDLDLDALGAASARRFLMTRLSFRSRWQVALLLALVWPGAVPAAEKADPAVDEVLKCIARNVPKQSSASDARFASTDPAGGTREFEARLLAKRMPDGLRRAKICVTAPPDLRGAQVLAMENEGRLPDSFLYTEELRTPKRITGSGLGGGIFGTDFTFEDFERFMNLNRVEALRRLPDDSLEGRPTFLLESTPFLPDRAHYSKARIWVDKGTCVLLQAEFYEAQDKPRRVLKADVAKIVTQGAMSYPGRLTMRDLADGSETLLEITAAEIDGELVTDGELQVGELGRYCR